MDTPRTLVPVIALTGYLGAGKTSLLNHLLRRPGARLGVVVNDFGDLNVDAALVTGQVNDAASISGGCLCCMPNGGGLDESLRKLAHPRLRLDAILVEASGTADPLALARLIRDSSVRRIRPGGIVEVIDALEHSNTVDIRPDPPARYAAATLVVVGKTDLLQIADRDRLLGHIKERVAIRNPRVQVVEARQGRIDPALVFDSAADMDPIDQFPLAELVRQQTPRHDHEHAAAVSVSLTSPVSPSALIDFLENPPPHAYRLKGRISVLGPRARRGYLINVTGRMIHIASLPGTSVCRRTGRDRPGP